MPDKIQPKVLVAIVLVLFAWSSAFTAIRAVGPHFDPGALALARQTVAVPLLALFMIGTKWVKPTAREWVLLTIFGLTWFSMYIVALNTAEQTLDAGTASFIVNIGPLLIAIGAGLFLGEGLPPKLVTGALVALGGVGVIAWATAQSDHLDIVGVGWALLAMLGYTIGVLTQKPTLRRLPSAQVTLIGATIAWFPLAFWAPTAVSNLAVAPAEAWWGVIWLGAIPTALGFGLWGYALKRMPAGRLGVTTYLVPPLVIIESAILLGEYPHPLAIVGGALALGGVALARRA
ncbi:drug/metabolite transporter (DMT)-like permease [Microbacteriaceae bacterium MWH-Ta3]|nr:drug/metabolite transporter (DMT)-like permease [Microbacteriaceae bacterium MWH-Ta3]